MREQTEMTATTTREYRTADKTLWGAGPWQDEPDKVQWVDEATGLDCLAVRGPHGGWCGYVGVPESHPWFGKGYSNCTRNCGESWCGHSPESSVQVHGGLTFADRCADATRESWEKMRARFPEWEREAQKYPRGDSAERIRTLAKYRDDFAAWVEHREAVGVCHVPAAGRPDHVWWFGFDCAHSGDLSPKYANQFRSTYRDEHDVYRTLDYVRDECTQLAAQLLAVGAA